MEAAANGRALGLVNANRLTITTPMVRLLREVAFGLKCYMRFWFSVVFAISLMLQVLLIFFGGQWMIVYKPVMNFIEPRLRHHFGGGDGSLIPVLVTGSVIGAVIYSAILGCLAALLLRLGRGAAPARVLGNPSETIKQKSTAVPADSTPDVKLAHLVKRPP